MAIEFIKEVKYTKKYVSIQVIFFIETRYIKKLMLNTNFYDIIKKASRSRHDGEYTDLKYTYKIDYDALENFLKKDTDFVHHTVTKIAKDDVIDCMDALFGYIEQQKLFPLNGRSEL